MKCKCMEERLMRPHFIRNTSLFVFNFFSYQELMVNCWHSSAELRPTFTQIVSFLEKTLTAMSGYIVIQNYKANINEEIYI